MNKNETGKCGSKECACDFKAYEESTCYEDYLMRSAELQNKCAKRPTGPTEPPRPLWHKPFA